MADGTATPSAVAGIAEVGSRVAADYPAAVLADSPVGYWRLGETSGTNAADSSGNAHAGTYTGSPTLGVTGLLYGDSNKAVSADGVDDYVDLSNPSALRLTSAFTLEAWINVPGSQSAIGTVIAQLYDGSTVNYMLGSYDGASDTLRPSVGWYNGGWQIALSPSAGITRDAVHHIVGTWDGTTLRIYIDGAETAGAITPGSSPSTPSTSGYRLLRRWDGAGTPYYKGVADELAIYSTALSATRILAHYNAGAPAATTVAAGNATASPVAVVGTGAVPASAAKGGATGAPDRVAGIGAVPAPIGQGNSAVVAPVVVGIGAVPPATAVGLAAGLAAPGVTAGVGAVPGVTVTGTSVAAPDRVAGMGAVPVPAVLGAATAAPARVLGTGAVPAPTVAAVSNGIALPGAAAGAGRVPGPTFPSGIPVAGPSVTLANPSAAADDILDTTTAHGFTAGQAVEFVSLTGGAGLSTGQRYYVLASSLGSTTFQVSLTPGGSPVNFTTNVTAGSVRLNSFAVSDVSALWVMNIKDADGSAIETNAAPFMKARLNWTVENAGGGAAEIDILGSDVPTWTAPRRLVIRGERDWSGELSNAHRGGRPVAVGVAGEAGWTVSALGLIHRLDYRIVRHVFVVNDNADVIVHDLLDEAQLNQNNGDMGFHMGDVHGTTVVRERDYCFGVGIGDAIRELAAIGRGFDWEIDADQRLNIWNGSRGTDTGRTLSESQCQDFDIDYDTAEMLTTVSALADPSDPFGPRHRMSRTGKAVDFGRRETAIDTDVISDIDTNPNYEDELYDAADALLKTDGGAFVTVKAMWTSDKAPWSMADVWLQDSVTVSMPDPLVPTLGATVDMRVTDVTVTIEPMPPRASGPPIYWVEYGFAGLVRDIDLTHEDPDGDN